MKITSFDLQRDIMEKLTDGKVGFYWELEESVPVVEVFMHNTKEEVDSKVKQIQERFMSADIPDAQIDLDSERLSNDYYRIMIYFTRNMVDTDFIKMIDILKDYGSHIWED